MGESDDSVSPNTCETMNCKLLLFTSLVFASFSICAQVDDTIKISIADIVLDGWHYEIGALAATRYCKGELCNGEFIDTFPNGKVSSKTFVIDGKAHGAFERYYENGQLMMHGTLEHGKQIGLWEHYYENGNLQAEAMYILKFPAPRSLITLYENGNIETEVAFLEEEEDVMLFRYDFFEDGTKDTSVELIDVNELIYQELFYHAKGYIRERAKFRSIDGMRHYFDTWYYYNEFGKIYHKEKLSED